MRLYKELKEQAWLANLEIPRRNLAIYTWGNVSAFDSRLAVFAIKPSGITYDTLRVEQMVIVDLDGRVVEGKLNPSSDTQTHAVLYRNFEGIGGITHTHSPYAVAWAQSKTEIPVLGTTHADHSHLTIPCTEYISKSEIKNDYEKETGKLIVRTFKTIPYKEQPMVLVAGHGPFTWGEDAMSSVYNAAVLEEIAKMGVFTFLINEQIKPLPRGTFKTLTLPNIYAQTAA